MELAIALATIGTIALLVNIYLLSKRTHKSH